MRASRHFKADLCDMASPSDSANLQSVPAEPHVFHEKKLWSWQQDFLKKTEDARCIYLNSPTGSGKSIPIIWLCSREVVTGKKALIVVPTHEVASNFRDPIPGKELVLEWRNGQKMSWRPNETLREGRLARLREFFRNKSPGIVVATHQALAMLSEEIEDSPELLDDTVLVIDEAHHVRHDDEVSAQTSMEYSRLGVVARQAIERSIKNRARLVLVTATPFRGDRLPILEKEVEGKHFTRYTRYMDAHLRDAGIDNVRFHLATYSGEVKDYPKALAKIYRENGVKFDTGVGVVYMPHTSSRYNRMNVESSLKKKDIQRREIVAALEMVGRRVHDWVDPVMQEASKKEFGEARRAGKALDIDTYLAMNLFQEGTDDPRIDHVVSIGYQGSVTRMVHRTGRTTRRHDGKKQTHVFVLMPRGNDPDDAVEFNRFLKTLCMAFIGQELFSIRELPKKRGCTSDVDEEAARDEHDTRASDDRLADLEAAVDAMAEASSYTEKDERGEPLPSSIHELHELGVKAAAENAASRGATKAEQKHAAKDARAIMPRLLHYMATWFADEIDAQIVELTKDGYHRSAPINGALLKRFQKLVTDHRSRVRAEAVSAVEAFVLKEKRLPGRSMTDAKERRTYELFNRLTSERHPWFIKGFKEQLKRMRSKSIIRRAHA